jgi:O-antigen/teichoic acid export membrane protein
VSRKKSIAIQGAGGYLLVFITLVEGLVLIPIYLTKIGAESFGIWATLLSLLTILSTVNFGLNNVINQKISSYYAKRNFLAVKEYFFSSVLIFMVISFIFLAISFVASYQLDLLITKTDVAYDLILKVYFLGVLFFLLNIFNDFFRGVAQALLKPLGVLVISITGKVLGIISIVVLLFVNFDLLSIPLGLLIGASLAFVCNLLIMQKHLHKLNSKGKANLRVIKDCLKDSPSLFGARISSVVFAKAPYILITYFASPSLTAVYTVIVKVGELLLQIVRIANNALVPALSHMSGESITKAQDLIKANLPILISLMAILFGSYIALNIGFIHIWVPSVDLHAITDLEVTIFLFGLGLFIFTINETCRLFIYSLADFNFASNITFISSQVFLLLMLILIPLWGLKGVAFSLMLSSIVALLGFSVKMNALRLIDHKALLKILPLIVIVSSIGYMTMDQFAFASDWLDFLLMAFSFFSILLLIFLAFMLKDFKRIWQMFVAKTKK